MIQSFLCALCQCVCVCVCVHVSHSRSRKPLGGLSRETAEIEVGNTHQKCPNQERCRQEPPCKGTEGNRGSYDAFTVCFWKPSALTSACVCKRRFFLVWINRNDIFTALIASLQLHPSPLRTILRLFFFLLSTLPVARVRHASLCWSVVENRFWATAWYSPQTRTAQSASSTLNM